MKAVDFMLNTVAREIDPKNDVAQHERVNASAENAKKN
jgi:hypothetical protein